MELSLDTAGNTAGIAVSQQGTLLAELHWQCHANHSVELLPAVDRLMHMTGISKSDLQVVFVCRGPGSYGGLRAGLSLAMGLAFGLGIDILGAGRLEIEAFQQAAYPGPVCVVHRAGRGELAWASYRSCGSGLRELVAPRLGWPQDLIEAAPAAALFCGEIDSDVAGLIKRRESEAPIVTGVAGSRRAGALAELAWQRYEGGERANGAYVAPLYLREPQITKPKPRP